MTARSVSFDTTLSAFGNNTGSRSHGELAGRMPSWQALHGGPRGGEEWPILVVSTVNRIQGWNLDGCPLQRSMVESGQSFRPILLEIRDTSVVRADQTEVHKWQQ